MKSLAHLILLALLLGSCSVSHPLDPTKPFVPVMTPELLTLQSAPAVPSFPIPGMAAPPPTPGAVGELQGKEVLLQLRGGMSIGPSDYRIGNLAAPQGPQEQAAKLRLSDFLKTLVDKKYDQKFIHPQWKVMISGLLDSQKENWPESVRIGSLVLEEEGLVRATVSFTGPAGRTEGWVYLEREGTEWMISDWQVDLLSIPLRDKTQVFDPEGFPLIRGIP